MQGAAFLAQGTLYPDVIESVSYAGGPSHVIKSHHNVGGLPETMKLKLVEPLRELFKDEVRALGRELGLDPAFVGRHPFPGPGLAIRIPGEVTPDAVKTLQDADAIWLDEIRKAGLREGAGAPRRNQRGRHDRRGVPLPLGGAGSRRHPHRQRGEGSTAWSTTSRRSRRVRSNGSEMSGKLSPLS